MKPLSTLLRFLNLFACAVLCGGLIMTVAALRPGLAGLPLSTAVPAQQLVVQRATWYMPFCGAFAALSAVFLLKRQAVTKEAARFYRAGLMCMIFTGLSSIYVGAVLDKEIRDWRVYILAAGRTARVSLADPEVPDIVSLSLVGQPGGIPGVVFTGAALGDQAGFSVAAGGTFTNGGGTDIVIGAPGADPSGRTSV